MKSLGQDLLLSLRALRKEPISAAITSITLALGIGLCTVSFSLVYGVFLRGLDVPEADRLTLIYRANPSRDNDQMWVTVHDFYDWREQQTTFEGLGHFSTGTVNVSGTTEPARYSGGFVSANLFNLLRVTPWLGTTFRVGDDEAGAPLTVVLSHQAWTTRYDSDPAIVGKPVIVNGEPATILGVMPEGFRFPQQQDIWVAQRDSRPQNPDRSRSPGFQVVGRLKDGVSKDQAELEMSVIAERLAQTYPASNEGITTRFRTFVEDDTGEEIRAVFGAMQVATIFVLLIAIANVANLLMTRATIRLREAAVRTALGATRMRVVMPFFTETLVLAGIGALIGMGIAYVGVGLFDGATQDVGKPYYMHFRVDFPILAFVVALTIFTSLVAGAAPAFHVLRDDVNATLRDESRGSSGVLGGRLTKALVTGEIALSCALLIGAGLMIKSIVKFRNYEHPFATETVFTARVGLFEAEYPDSGGRREFFRNLLARLEAMPGARSVALTSNLPLNNGGMSIGIAGQTYALEQDYPTVQMAIVTPGFFRTFDNPILKGRDFTVTDDLAGPPVAIVNQAFAERFFPGVEVLGQRFAERRGDSLGVWHTIVGVVPDMRMDGFDPDRPNPSGYYVPIAQRDVRFATMAVQAAGSDPMALTPTIREVVAGLNPNLPIYNVNSMLEVARQAGWFYQVFGTLFIVFGAAALFMATVGLYGVLSFSVSRRTRELGIRMALGATARDVIRLILRQGGKQIGVGLAVGLLMAFGLTRVIGILMFDITPQDPPVFSLVVVTIAAVGMFASLVPARRATLTEPTAALRHE